MGKLIILSVLAPFLILFPSLAILELHYAYQVIADGASTTGTVVSYGSREVLTSRFGSRSRSRSRSVSKNVSFPIVEFSVQDKVFRAAGPDSSLKSYGLGEKVPIRYIKSNPNQVVFESFYNFLMLFVATFLCLVIYSLAFKIFSHQSDIKFPVSKARTTKPHLGALIAMYPFPVISMLLGLLIITIGFYSGFNRIKLFVYGDIYSGIVIESKLETVKETIRFLGTKIKYSSSGTRSLAEYVDPSSGDVIQEEVISYMNNQIYPGLPIQFLKVPNEKPINLDLRWFFMTPLILVSLGWGFCITSFAYLKSKI
jgi:hypothetical protein